MAMRPAATGTVSLPIPSDYSGQTVIAFRIQCDPASALKSWKWEPRSTGLNRMVVVSVAPPIGGAWISYEARVLIPGYEVIRTQRQNFKDWSLPSPLVQSVDPTVVSIANWLKRDGQDQKQFVESVVTWVAQNKTGLGINSRNSDARSAVSTGGDSLNRANLCAAILRAAKVNARTISYFPTNSARINGPGGEAQSWLTEYASEEGNWQMVDPTVGVHHPARNSVIVLTIPSRTDERRTSKNETAWTPNAPVLSTPALSSNLTWSQQLLRQSSDRRVTKVQVIQNFPGPSGARLMSAAARRSLKVTDAALKGQPEWFDERAFQDALSLGPTNLALFLDGRPTLPPR